MSIVKLLYRCIKFVLLRTLEHCYSQMINTARITIQIQHNAFQRNPSAEITFREGGKVEMNKLQLLV